MSKENNKKGAHKIAIIGMSCRMPGADNIKEFWNNLVQGVESITTFTDEELRKSGVSESVINDPNYVKSRGIVDGADLFDATFFGITPRDAEIMDPQHRTFLECAWHSLEDAGYDPEKTEARIGVFGGTGTAWYLNSVTTNGQVAKYSSGTSIITATDRDYAATRVSYKLNLKGPSLTVQSACSTSMVAVVLGINSLLSYQCDMVIAGGATVHLPERKGYMYYEGGIESIDGVCRTFDKDASGTVFSRGAGTVLLKRYEDAVADGDHIYATILGGAINNDGGNKAGFTAPSVEGQVEAALEAIELANITADTITYVEAHGTATNVGDPIEVSSLSEAFGSYTDKKQFCAIGSVKTNIGHLDSASGVAGLMKAVLALHEKKIPAHLNYKVPNPKIDFPNSPFYVNTETKEWHKNGVPRRALVNSFGVGGTNACVVLEEPPEVVKNNAEEQINTLCLSAKNDEALEDSRANLLEFLNENENINCSDLAYTYQVGRRAFSNRGILTFSNQEELISKLDSIDNLQRGNCDEDDKPLVFMFPGQGNQYFKMGFDLYQKNELFKNTVDYCCKYILDEFGIDIKEVLFFEKDPIKAKAALEQTYITQPAIFIISYAMAELSLSKGLKPEALIGHSVGEYVAACVSGIMSLEDALKAVTKRGQLIQDLPGGSMLAVLKNEDKILPLLFDGVEVAAINNPGLTVVAGSDENIEKLESKLKDIGFFSKRLSTSHAFHSAMMDPCLDEFSKIFDNIELSAPKIPIISTVTGEFMTAEEAVDPNYWVMHVRKSVRFSDAVMTCLDMNPSVFVEIGPGQSLESAVKRHLNNDSAHASTRTMKTENEDFDDNEYFANAIGSIWLVGGDINWDTFYKNQNRNRISLPCYPYQRQSYAIDFSQSVTAKSPENFVRIEEGNEWYNIPVWKRTPNNKYLSSSLEEQNSWLIFHDKYGLGEALKESLLKMGQQVFEVHPGEYYRKEEYTKFIIDLGNKDHYSDMFKDLFKDDFVLNHIVHLTNYSHDTTKELSFSELTKAEQSAFFSPMFIYQSLITKNKLKDLQFSFVANGAFDVIGEKVYAPEKSLGIGPSRVLIQEFPYCRSRFIDVDIQQDANGRMQLAQNIINETTNTSFETLVAFRNHHRWVESYEQLPFVPKEKPKYVDGGVYLITGGLGGIGVISAKAIAQEVKATFVLTYYSAIPPRSEWDKYLDENPGFSLTREKIEAVRMLEELGSTVIEKQIDVADYEGMKKLVLEVEEDAGKIKGVIHSAGKAGGGIIALRTAEAVQSVFNSKMKGLLVLDDIFSSHNLDFFILYSSVTSIEGDATRLEYTSANAFLDSFAAYRRSIKNDNTMAINWPGWEDTGMAVRWDKEKKAKENSLEVRPDYSEHTVLRDSKDLLTFVSDIDGTLTYDVNFQPKQDWIINSHFIINIPTVVGTTFIELAHQFSKIVFPGKNVELKNLYFLSPMMFEHAKPKKVRLVAVRKGDKYNFSFNTQGANKDSDSSVWSKHFMGEVSLANEEIQSFDLTGTINRLSGEIDETKRPRLILNKQNTPLIDLGERWDIDNKIYVGEKEWLAKLTLRPEFEGDTDNFDFHPAMMDKATSFAIRYTSKSTHLPFSYSSVKPIAKLPACVYAYVTSDATEEETDALSFNVTLVDEDGNRLIEIESYTLKQVNDLEGPKSEHKKRMEELALKIKERNDFIFKNEGERVITQLLNSDFPSQVIVYPFDFNDKLIFNQPTAKKIEERQGQLNSGSKSYYSRPSLSTPYEEPETEMEKNIAGIWQDILGIEKIGRKDNFAELGGNSLLAIQAIANISDVLEVELSAQDFYDSPTIAGLAETVVGSIMELGDVEDLEALIQSMSEEN
ncbi:MAG: acyltransferase domain-containing protein [Saprospiraceae bacterium]|nr:acyltransferase domain-containing protein [Saprospiraceae bacterium]